MPAPIQSFRTFAGIAKESTWGTGVSPATNDQFFGVLNPKPQNQLGEVYDRGYRSLGSEVFGIYQGFRMAQYQWDMQGYVLPIGHALMGVFGQDTLTGAGPYTHTFKALNTGLPPSYSITEFDATIANARQWTGHYFKSVQIGYAAGVNGGELKVSATTLGKWETPGGVTAPSTLYDTASPFLPYQNALTLATVANTKLVSLQVTLDRDYEAIFGSGGTQDATAGNVGPLRAQGSMVFVLSDATEYDYFRNGTSPAFSTVFTSGTNTLTLAMSKCWFGAGTVIDRSSQYVKLSVPFKGYYNSTDGGPASAVLVNGKTPAY